MKSIIKNKFLELLNSSILLYILSFILGYFIFSQARSFFYGRIEICTSAIRMPFLLFSLIMGIFININFHEFGHFVMGRLSGYKLLRYRCSIFCWQNKNGKMKLSIKKNNFFKNLFSGLCEMVPVKKDLPKYKRILYYSGGGIFNIGLFIVFVSFSIFFSNYSNLASYFLLETALFGLIFGIFNLLPYYYDHMPSDGMIIFSTILDGDLGNKYIEWDKIEFQLLSGTRPGNLNISWDFDLDNIVRFDVILLKFFYYKELDNNNLKKCRKYINLIERNLDSISSNLCEELFYEICYHACITNDKAKAKKYYKKCGKALQKDNDVKGLRVKAYYEYYVNENNELAIKYCDDALAVVNEYPLKGQALMEKDLVKDLKKSMEGVSNV